jgi:hypothetical protein
MKKIRIGSFCLLFVLASTTSFSQDYKSALGVRLSSAAPVVNNAVSFKYFIDETYALEGLLSFGDPVAIGAMLQIHKPLNNVNGLKWYYGGGAYIGFPSKSISVGGMGVVGLDYKFDNIPLNLSLDWKPELNIVPNITFEAAAIAVSARFTFGGGRD